MGTPRATTTSLAILAASLAAASPARAQAPAAVADSEPHFSLFGSAAPAQHGGLGTVLLGASGDFRWHPVPVPLRLSVAFMEHHEASYITTPRTGFASLDLVMRPMARRFGIRPYLLGGLGLATQSGYSVRNTFQGPDGPRIFDYTYQRRTWAFASAGVGLDVGRAFIQLRLDRPVASDGPSSLGGTIGFRFWDE